MSDKLWKATERKIAKYLGGWRNPVHGSGAKCDVSTDILSIEVKEREQLPALLRDALIEAKTNCEEGKIHCIVLHQKGQHIAKAMIIFELKDYRDWYI